MPELTGAETIGIMTTICVFFTNLMHLQFMRQLLPSRLTGRTAMLTAIGLACLGIPKLIFGLLSLFTRVYIICLAVFYALILPVVLFRGKLWKRLVINFYFTALQVFSDTLSVGLFFYGEEPREYMEWELMQTALYMLTTVVIFALAGILSVYLGRKLYLGRFRFFYLLLFPFSMSLWILAYCCVYHPRGDVWILGVLLGILTQMAFLGMFGSLEKKVALEQEMQELRHALERERIHCQALDEQREELEKIRHDFNNHLAVISQLVNAGEREDARQMIRRLEKDLIRTEEEARSGSD